MLHSHWFPKMVGHNLPPPTICQELVVQWEGELPFPIVSSIENQPFFVAPRLLGQWCQRVKPVPSFWACLPPPPFQCTQGYLRWLDNLEPKLYGVKLFMLDGWEVHVCMVILSLPQGRDHTHSKTLVSKQSLASEGEKNNYLDMCLILRSLVLRYLPLCFFGLKPSISKPDWKR